METVNAPEIDSVVHSATGGLYLNREGICSWLRKDQKEYLSHGSKENEANEAIDDYISGLIARFNEMHI